jgi:hypothetical protein
MITSDRQIFLPIMNCVLRSANILKSDSHRAVSSLLGHGELAPLLAGNEDGEVA